MSTKRKPKCPHTAGHICNTFMPCDEKCSYFSSKIVEENFSSHNERRYAIKTATVR